LFYGSDFRLFDQNSLQEIETEAIYGKYENVTIPDKLVRMNYDIHIGAIGGIVIKIIPFIISLLTASSTVTCYYYGTAGNTKENTSIEN
jgi:hypothetical protein